KTSEPATTAKSEPRWPHFAQRHDLDSVFRLQRAVGNQTVLRLLVARTPRRLLEAPWDEQPKVTDQAAPPRFEHDVSSVRVGTGMSAAQSAEAVHGHASTTGRDLAFGRGQYAPRTREGQRPLAHELAHVVQPRSGSVSGQLIQRDLIPYGQLAWNDF